LIDLLSQLRKQIKSIAINISIVLEL
jgi:hypothetical protein